MKPVAKWFICTLLLAGCAQRPDTPPEAAVVRAQEEGGVILRCRLSDTNLLAGATATLELQLEAPAELDVDFKRLTFDGFLVFAEEHPAYAMTGRGNLTYRHIYHLQVRRPGTPSIPEIKVRVREPLKEGESRELVLPPLPVRVRGIEVQTENGLQWNDPVEVTL
ncbi:hypothetical protein ACFLQY_00960 [Verrucomicrobiota bacterium]